MKRVHWLAILAGLVLAVGLVCTAQAADPLPAEIRDSIAEMQILKTAYWDSPGSTWFVFARTPYGANMLLCFVQEGGSWVRSFYTVDAVPQGEDVIKYLFITDKVIDFRDNQTRVIPGPILALSETSGCRTSYRRDDAGQWKLYDAFWLKEQMSLDFSDDGIVFRSPIDQDHDRVETVHGRFERDLRKVDYDAIPRTPQQARETPGGS